MCWAGGPGFGLRRVAVARPHPPFTSLHAPPSRSFIFLCHVAVLFYFFFLPALSAPSNWAAVAPPFQPIRDGALRFLPRCPFPFEPLDTDRATAILSFNYYFPPASARQGPATAVCPPWSPPPFPPPGAPPPSPPSSPPAAPQQEIAAPAARDYPSQQRPPSQQSRTVPTSEPARAAGSTRRVLSQAGALPQGYIIIRRLHLWASSSCCCCW